MKTLFISTFIVFAHFGLSSQTLNIRSDQMTLRELFIEIEAQTDLHFVFSEDDIDVNAPISSIEGEFELDDLLKKIAKAQPMRFKRIEKNIVVSTDTQSNNSELIYKTVRGVVKDVGTGMTLPAANVYVVEFPENSGVTDLDGHFQLQVPVGRVNLAVSYIGYQSVITPLLVNTGQEQFLTIDLEASIESLNEVVVEADRDRARTMNELAYASGRSFNVLEANKYAGTLGDPARMTRSFAGVVPTRDDRNDIIIRGNSPTGIQWRLDGIEIPNPNHYGGIGLTGNTTTLLNMNLIGNSDFLMGAFPSEYGNALSGVFDLHLKAVNPKKRQYRFQTGWNGFEFGAEGPFSKQKDIGTYSLTYRYSFLDIVKYIGVDFGVLPQFQDLTGYFNFNLSEKTTISVIGIGATSFIELDDRDLDSTDMRSPGEYLTTGSDLWLGGVNINHRFNDKVSLKSGLSVIDNSINTHIDTFNVENNQSALVYKDRSGETKYSFFFELNHRTLRNSTKYGLRWDTYDIRYHSAGAASNRTLATIHDKNATINLLRTYIENEYRFTDHFRARGGVHIQYFLLNQSMAVEPRIAARYLLNDYNALAVSYGNHHQMQPRTVYFVESVNGLSNKDLDFSGAHHYTLSYDGSITENLRIKAETYYQHLYDIPVESDPTSTFSMLNVGADFYIPQHDSLVNKGIGRNYGLELTLERFLDKGYYFMVNGSLFKSEYQALDKKWRSTAFDMLYTANALGGYEYWINQKLAFGADLKASYAGGKPYTPVNEAASVLANVEVLDESKAFTKRHPDYFRTDLKIYYRINYKKVYTEFAMDLQNLTNHQNIFSRQFDPRTGDYITFYHMGFFPMFTFRCLF
ncbi:MAG: TonB-dependent receptor [Flavobacteriales bacterium]